MKNNKNKPLEIALNSEELMRRIKHDKIVYNDNEYLRLHRGIRWLKAAEIHQEDSDIAFICLWISLNACYGRDVKMNDNKGKQGTSEKKGIIRFLSTILSLDKEKRIDNLIWNRYAQEIRIIIENKFLFDDFWTSTRLNNTTYKSKLKKSIASANKFLSGRDLLPTLVIILDRLYVLRNQIFHGGSTHKSSLNRHQVKDANNLLKYLMPIIIEIMIENKEVDWGVIWYPVIK